MNWSDFILCFVTFTTIHYYTTVTLQVHYNETNKDIWNMKLAQIIAKII